MNTRDIIQSWTDWLRVAERLLLALHEQTVAVTLRDVPRVERLNPEIAMLMEEVRDIDARAVAALQALALRLDVEPSLRNLVEALPKAEGQPLHALANKIVAVEHKIGGVIAKNRQLIESEMTYVNGTLTLIARAAAPKRSRSPYRSKAPAPQAVLMDSAA